MVAATRRELVIVLLRLSIVIVITIFLDSCTFAHVHFSGQLCFVLGVGIAAWGSVSRISIGILASCSGLFQTLSSKPAVEVC